VTGGGETVTGGGVWGVTVTGAGAGGVMVTVGPGLTALFAAIRHGLEAFPASLNCLLAAQLLPAGSS
jgi:hypothetical protein